MNPQGARLSAFLVRVTLGVCFSLHGWTKLFSLLGSDSTWLRHVKGMDLEPPMLFAVVIALLEALSGAALVLGLFPQIAAGVVVILMGGAIWLVHGANGYFITTGGYEYCIALIAMAVSIMFTGPGAYAMRLRSKKEGG